MSIRNLFGKTRAIEPLEYTHVIMGYVPNGESIPHDVGVIAFDESQNAFVVEIPILILSMPAKNRQGEVQSPYGIEKITLSDYRSYLSHAVVL